MLPADSESELSSKLSFLEYLAALSLPLPFATPL